MRYSIMIALICVNGSVGKTPRVNFSHTTHTYQLPSSPWAGTLDRFKRSQRCDPELAGPLPAKNERMQLQHYDCIDLYEW